MGRSTHLPRATRRAPGTPSRPIKLRPACRAPRRTVVPHRTKLCRTAPHAAPRAALSPPRAARPPEPAGCEDAAIMARAVRPSAFKALIGRGHAEFSTGRQQDAQEFLQHLVEQVGPIQLFSPLVDFQ